jgi:hypothetical protein
MCCFHRFVVPVCLVLMLSPCPSAAEQMESYRYQQLTGSQVVYIDWQLAKGETLRLQTRQQEELTQTRLSSDLSTLSWKILNPQNRTDLTVNRAGDTLAMQGVFAGEVINKEVQIDAAPWYQALSVSLRQFIAPGQDSIQFWTIRPDTLDVHRLQAVRQENTFLKIGHDSIPSILLKIQPFGWRASLWSAQYWLRENDGVFIRYQSRSKVPGAPSVSVVLVDPDAPDPASNRNL